MEIILIYLNHALKRGILGIQQLRAVQKGTVQARVWWDMTDPEWMPKSSNQ